VCERREEREERKRERVNNIKKCKKKKKAVVRRTKKAKIYLGDEYIKIYINVFIIITMFLLEEEKGEE